MKRLWYCMACLVLLLCSCQPAAQKVTLEGKDFTVDRDEGTITCEGEVYYFRITDGIAGKDVEFSYPDGSRCIYSWQNTNAAGMGFSGMSLDYDPEANGYVPGDTLWAVLDLALEVGKAPVSVENIALVIIAVVGGAFLLFWPRLAWTLACGWRYKDAEPSTLALSLNRLWGGLALGSGTLYLLYLLHR